MSMWQHTNTHRHTCACALLCYQRRPVYMCAIVHMLCLHVSFCIHANPHSCIHGLTLPFSMFHRPYRCFHFRFLNADYWKSGASELRFLNADYWIMPDLARTCVEWWIYLASFQYILPDPRPLSCQIPDHCPPISCQLPENYLVYLAGSPIYGSREP